MFYMPYPYETSFYLGSPEYRGGLPFGRNQRSFDKAILIPKYGWAALPLTLKTPLRICDQLCDRFYHDFFAMLPMEQRVIDSLCSHGSQKMSELEQSTSRKSQIIKPDCVTRTAVSRLMLKNVLVRTKVSRGWYVYYLYCL